MAVKKRRKTGTCPTCGANVYERDGKAEYACDCREYRRLMPPMPYVPPVVVPNPVPYPVYPPYPTSPFWYADNTASWTTGELTIATQTGATA